ncbi:hypothetical protein AGRA671_20190 [Agrobacterium radiobacter]|nr:Uncharacterised protein [Agrobacterium tumefaciens]
MALTIERMRPCQTGQKVWRGAQIEKLGSFRSYDDGLPEPTSLFDQYGSEGVQLHGPRRRFDSTKATTRAPVVDALCLRQGRPVFSHSGLRGHSLLRSPPTVLDDDTGRKLLSGIANSLNPTFPDRAHDCSPPESRGRAVDPLQPFEEWRAAVHSIQAQYGYRAYLERPQWKG